MPHYFDGKQISSLCKDNATLLYGTQMSVLCIENVTLL